MTSSYEDQFLSVAWPAILAEFGDSVTYDNPDDGTSQSLTAVAQEYVGAVDEYQRKIWRFAAADLTVSTAPENGHQVTDGDGVWTIINVRNLNVGLWEVYAELPLARS